MSVEAAKEIISKLDAHITERDAGSPLFADPGITAFPISREAFHQVRNVPSNRRVGFVDGGNLEILGAPNFSVQFNRVFACLWKNNQRQSLNLPLVEFFSAIYSTLIDGGISYETIIVPSKPEDSTLLPDSVDLTFSSTDRSVMVGTQMADTSRIASIARNFAEWKFGALLCEELERDDILVMDGSLQTQFTNEWKYFTKLENTAKDRGVLFTSLAKTSRLFTTTGLSLLGAVNQFAEQEKIEGEWYIPIFESPKHHIYGMVVKLKAFSDWVFRFDIQRDQYQELSEENVNEILSLLCSNASDPVFPGYPFGSIVADQYSRVSENEVDYYRPILYSQISGLNKQNKFKYQIRAGDAHDILNMIVGR